MVTVRSSIFYIKKSASCTLGVFMCSALCPPPTKQPLQPVHQCFQPSFARGPPLSLIYLCGLPTLRISCYLSKEVTSLPNSFLYRVIHKSLRDFRTRLRNNQDRHGRKERINRYRISPSFFVLGALAYFQVPPLGGSREEKWRSQ